MSEELNLADANLHTLHAERAALRLAAQTARRKCWWLARWPMARATKPARKRRGRGRHNCSPLLTQRMWRATLTPHPLCHF
jgi:hypothetical protein